MAWIAIAESDVLTHISGTELEALRAAALKAGQVDPVQPSITQVTGTVRGYVSGCKANALDADVTKIPPTLLDAALDMIFMTIASRVPDYPIDENRERKYKQAVRLMETVASCKFGVEDPNTGLVAGTGVEQASSTTRISTRTSLNGL